MDLKDKGIAVFCASSANVPAHYLDMATDVGFELGQRGAMIVYGGASVGLMGRVAEGAMSAGGKVFGVIPKVLMAREVAHVGIQELVVVETMHQRKALMSERSAAYVVLPGGFGTYEEFYEVLTWKQLRIHRKPIVLVNFRGYYDSLLAQTAHAIAEGMIKPAYRDLFTVVPDVAGLIATLEAVPEPDLTEESWI